MSTNAIHVDSVKSTNENPATSKVRPETHEEVLARGRATQAARRALEGPAALGPRRVAERLAIAEAKAAKLRAQQAEMDRKAAVRAAREAKRAAKAVVAATNQASRSPDGALARLCAVEQRLARLERELGIGGAS